MQATEHLFKLSHCMKKWVRESAGSGTSECEAICKALQGWIKLRKKRKKSQFDHRFTSEKGFAKVDFERLVFDGETFIHSSRELEQILLVLYISEDFEGLTGTWPFIASIGCERVFVEWSIYADSYKDTSSKRISHWIFKIGGGGGFPEQSNHPWLIAIKCLP